MFDEMVKRIQRDTVVQLMKVEVVKEDEGASKMKIGQQAAAKKAPAVSGKGVGRNDPCPCGSGKKYKNCCGR